MKEVRGIFVSLSILGDHASFIQQVARYGEWNRHKVAILRARSQQSSEWGRGIIIEEIPMMSMPLGANAI